MKIFTIGFTKTSARSFFTKLGMVFKTPVAVATESIYST